MIVAVPKEVLPYEKRVAVTPETVQKLKALGLKVLVQAGAGENSSITDENFKEAGAEIVSDASRLFKEADLIFKVRYPVYSSTENLPDEVSLLKKESIVIGLLQPLTQPELVKKLAEQEVTAFSMDMVPRIARAQKLDALSSQSNVAGYKAVLMASNYLGKMMPMMMTAAGTISAARVLILGAGVAGLQAIATAKRLGAVVEAYDVRAAAKDQVESLGAKFLSLETNAEIEDKQGYAKEQTDDAKARGEALIAEHVKQADIVITTALIPGKPSPKLITESMVKSMQEGSVIVDLAVEGGGNCELSEPAQNVSKHGVMIMGEMNVPSLMAAQSSQLYARNIFNLFSEFYQDGSVRLDLENEVIKGALITNKGSVVHEALTPNGTRT